jgi:hypothetical protein
MLTLSVDNNIFTNEVFILAVVPATFHVMVYDEFPAHVIPVVFVMLLQMVLRWHLL